MTEIAASSDLCGVLVSSSATSCVTVVDSVTEAAGSSTIRAGNTMMDMLYYSVGVLGVLGNTLIIVVAMNYKKMKESIQDFFIVNQSIIDLVSALMLILLTATVKTTADWDMSGLLGQILCHTWYNSLPLWALFFVSTVNLIVLTLERYLEVVHPLWHRANVSKKRARIVVGIVWTMLLYQIIVHLLTTAVTSGKCYPLSNWRSSFARIFYGHFNATVRCYIPVGLMLFCYPAMLWKLRQQNRRVGRLLNKKNRLIAKARRNIVMTLVTVSVAYISCWTMNQIIYLRFLHGFDLDFTGVLYNISVVLIFINCCINPIIYACRYKTFQNGVRHLIRLIRNHNKTAPSSFIASDDEAFRSKIQASMQDSHNVEGTVLKGEVSQNAVETLQECETCSHDNTMSVVNESSRPVNRVFAISKREFDV